MISLNEFKQSVLQKAMQGKLTKQLPSDGNASDLLKSILQKKNELIRTKKIKRHKPIKPISRDKIPFEIPINWKWTRLTSLLKLGKGSIRRGPFGSSITKSMFVPKSRNTYKVYEQGNAINKSFNYGHYYITAEKYSEMNSFHIAPGDIIVSCAGTIGRTYVLPSNCPRGIINQALIRIRLNTNIVNKTFFLLLFRNKLGIIRSSSIGSAIKNMASIRTLKNKLLWQLPPLSEQKRIVRKVHECFEFADTVQKERQLNQKFAKDMKQSLLRAAMQGKLTQQRPSDGTASDLLKSIRQRKQQLIKAKKIRKRKPLPPVKPSEIPFAIPRNWRWTRLGCIGSWKAGSTPRKGDLEYYKNGTIPWLNIGDLNDSYINKASNYITKLGFENNSLRLNPKGSIVMAMYGSIDKLGILDIKATTNQACCACIVCDEIDNIFLFYYLLSQRINFIKMGLGTTQSNISRTKIIHYLIPIHHY